MAENEYVIVNKADFEKIGNAVRTSNGTTDKYSISELADAVANSIVPSPGEDSAYKTLMTNSQGKIKWDDRLAYSPDDARVVVKTDNYKFVWITENLPTLEQLQNGKFTLWITEKLSSGKERNKSIICAAIKPEDNYPWLLYEATESDAASHVPYGIICLKDNLAVDGIVFPQAGIYVFYSEDDGDENK